MNRSQTGQPARMASATTTGRDGAIDHVGKEDFLHDTQAGLDGHVYRVIELVGSSEESIEAAINSALTRAHKTLRNLRWFEVLRTSGHIEDGKARHYQVTLKVGFTMEDAR